MTFRETRLPGVWEIDPEPLVDARGWFGRVFDEREFREHGLEPRVVQASVSFNHRRGTLRGMHYQADPHGEPKLVRCTQGAVFDVAVDLRPDSRTYLAWHGAELSAANRRALYMPPGIAHGFQTLEPDTEVLYQMGYPYVPEAACGVRFDDPTFAITWPEAPDGRVISERDRSYPDFSPATGGATSSAS